MIARDRIPGARVHGAHHQAKHIGVARTVIHQIAQKNELASARMSDRRLQTIPQLPQQLEQLVAAAMHRTHDIERTGLVLPIAPQRQPLNFGGSNFLA